MDFTMHMSRQLPWQIGLWQRSFHASKERGWKMESETDLSLFDHPPWRLKNFLLYLLPPFIPCWLLLEILLWGLLSSLLLSHSYGCYLSPQVYLPLCWIKESPIYPSSAGCMGLSLLLGTEKNIHCEEAETTPAIYKTKPSSANLNGFT